MIIQEIANYEGSEAGDYLRLAQAYRDSGENEKAIEYYLKHSEQSSCNEEIFVSLLQAGLAMERLGRPVDQVLEVYDRASAACPWRAEALHAASRLCRNNRRYAEGYERAKRGLAIIQPQDGLSLESWIYEHGLLDEFAVNAYWIERYQECFDACQQILTLSHLDEATRSRVAANAKFAMDKVGLARRPKKCVVITPYYKEDRVVLERCIKSVKEQTIATDHILVADGFPQDWLDLEKVRHLRLDQAHADYGNTPRCMAALMAVAEGYEVIAFLDADCWFEPDHMKFCLAAAEKVGFDKCGYVVAGRTLRRPDGSIINIITESPEIHADTSSMVLLQPSFGTLASWALMPRELTVVGDRLVYLVMKSSGGAAAYAPENTVNYTCTWASIYRAIGEEPPLPLKENPDHGWIRHWVESLDEATIARLKTLLQVDVRALYDPTKSSTQSEPTNPPTDDPAFRQAKILFQHGQFRAAEEAFAALRSGPADPDELDYYQGKIHRALQPWQGRQPPVLLWRSDDKTHWELDWLKELLQGVPYIDRIADEGDVFAEHMVVCDNHLSMEKSLYYKEAYRRGCRVHLIHLSDERFEDDCSAYRWCETVFRNYYSPILDELPNVYTFALGYKAGFTRGLVDRPAIERPYAWCFAGHRRVPSRGAMLDALAELTPNKAHIASGFNTSDGLSLDEYRTLMQESLFVPCPAGFWSLDTFRTYEALEAGAIPIVERRPGFDYCFSAYGPNPIPAVEAWGEASGLIRQIIGNGQAEELRSRCISWWKGYKKALSKLFRQKLVDGSHSESDSHPKQPVSNLVSLSPD